MRKIFKIFKDLLDRYSVGNFQETEQLRTALEKEVFKIEVIKWFSIVAMTTIHKNGIGFLFPQMLVAKCCGSTSCEFVCTQVTFFFFIC